MAVLDHLGSAGIRVSTASTVKRTSANVGRAGIGVGVSSTIELILAERMALAPTLTLGGLNMRAAPVIIPILASGRISLPTPAARATLGWLIGRPSLPALSGSGRLDVGSLLAGKPSLPRLSMRGALSVPTAVRVASVLPVLGSRGRVVLSILASGRPLLPASLVASGRLVTGIRLAGRINLLAIYARARETTPLLLSGVIKLPGLSVYAPMTAGKPVASHIVAMGLRAGAVTELHQLQANSIATYAGSVLLATPAGILRVNGQTDRGSPVAWQWRSGKFDMGEDALKRAGNVYLGLVAQGDLQLDVVTHQGEFSYTVAAMDSEAIRECKTAIGRGLRARYWQIGMTGDAAFRLDGLTVDMLGMQRRV